MQYVLNYGKCIQVHICMHRKKEKKLNCEQCMSLADGNTGENFIFLKGFDIFHFLQESNNFILYSEKDTKRREGH